jgi:uncharacterized protein
VTVSRDQLTSITNAICEASKPRLVILFGSQARGTADKHSDIDLLIIGDRPSEKWSRRHEIGKIRRSLPPINIPVDVLFFTTDEARTWRNTTNHIIRDAFLEGEVLYERR